MRDLQVSRNPNYRMRGALKRPEYAVHYHLIERYLDDPEGLSDDERKQLNKIMESFPFLAAELARAKNITKKRKKWSHTHSD